ncbi:hypothetical protein DFH29DRAFT_964089, partial [Suillus ampliporus]
MRLPTSAEFWFHHAVATLFCALFQGNKCTAADPRRNFMPRSQLARHLVKGVEVFGSDSISSYFSRTDVYCIVAYPLAVFDQISWLDSLPYLPSIGVTGHPHDR